MKDHEFRELVNQLRDIAVEYRDTQQLRERIAHAVSAVMKPGTLTNEGTIQSGNSGKLNRVNSFTDDELMGMAHGDNPVANAYWELLEFRRNAAGGNSGQPVTVPAGYVLVQVDLLSDLRDFAHPEIEKYCEMWEGRRDAEFPAMRKIISDADALLAAGWIPVSERLPDKVGLYLCWGTYFDGDEPDYIPASFFIHPTNGWSKWEPVEDDCDPNCVTITHWQPLPDAPKVTP